MENTIRTRQARDRRRTSTGPADQAGWELPDTHGEVATVLLGKRWEKQEEPFQGFDSPPGKF